MLVRIKGVIDDIIMQEGVGKTSQKPWKKKTYVIRDNTYNKEVYNKKVHVDDLGKLDPDKMNPEFIFRSNHVVGEEVDLACYLETNDYGFTNVSYGKLYEEIGNKPQQANVIRPDDQPAQEQDPEAGPFGSVNAGSTLPF